MNDIKTVIEGSWDRRGLILYALVGIAITTIMFWLFATRAMFVAGLVTTSVAAACITVTFIEADVIVRPRAILHAFVSDFIHSIAILYSGAFSIVEAERFLGGSDSVVLNVVSFVIFGLLTALIATRFALWPVNAADGPHWWKAPLESWDSSRSTWREKSVSLLLIVGCWGVVFFAAARATNYLWEFEQPFRVTLTWASVLLIPTKLIYSVWAGVWFNERDDSELDSQVSVFE